MCHGWVLIDTETTNVGSYVAQAREVLDKGLKLPPGYSLSWSGQYEYITRVETKLATVVPLTLGIVFLLLYANFRRFSDVALIMGTLPVAAVGAVILMARLNYNFSVAVAVGFIALAGVAVETGVIMLVYLRHAHQSLPSPNQNNAIPLDQEALKNAICEGAIRRVRPVMMTSASIILGLLPVMLGGGAGSEMMSRIAAPVAGGMVSVLALTLLVLPVLYYLLHCRIWR